MLNALNVWLRWLHLFKLICVQYKSDETFYVSISISDVLEFPFHKNFYNAIFYRPIVFQTVNTILQLKEYFLHKLIPDWKWN